jgi:hypothetical protein
MAYAIPPRPASFTPQGVAPGCERIPNLYPRDLMGRRVDVLSVHTNWASGGPATVESAIRWSLANVGVNTYAHYQHERSGRAGKMLDSDRRGIGTGGVSSWWRETYGLPNASYRALTYETSDLGTIEDPAPEGTAFLTPQQSASLARDLAYEAVVHDIPPILLPSPEKRGIAGHCIPYPYPAFTTAKGKMCPGTRKFEQLVDEVIPWTEAIVSAWTGAQSVPPPVRPTVPNPDTEVGVDAPEEALFMLMIAREVKTDVVWVGDGVTRRSLSTPDELYALTAAARTSAVRLVTPLAKQGPADNNVANVWYHGDVQTVGADVLAALGAVG